MSTNAARVPESDKQFVICETREEWLAQRSQGIGGSEAAIIMGASKWGSPYSLWAQKAGLVQPDDGDSDLLRFGRVVEPLIAQDYERLTGRKLVDLGAFTIRRHPELPFMICTHDRLIEPIDDRGPGILSIKTAAAFKEDEWSEAEAPLSYQVQIQHEMAVSGARWGSFAVLLWGRPVQWFDVERNDNFIEALTDEERAFWRRVETGDAPAVDGSEHTSTALKKLHPKDTGEVVTLGEEALAIHERLSKAKEKGKAWKEEEEKAKNQLKALMGSATEAALPGGIRYTLKTISKAGYPVAPQEYRELRAKLPKVAKGGK